MSDAHYHVTVNGVTQSFAYVEHALCDAIRTEHETRESAAPGAVIEIVACRVADCGDYLDLLAFEADAEHLADDAYLDMEHTRMIIESDGYGPI